MKLSTVAVLGAGYVLGARAGHERYQQLYSAARRVAGEFDTASIRSAIETLTTRLEHYADADNAADSNGSPARGQGEH